MIPRYISGFGLSAALGWLARPAIAPEEARARLRAELGLPPGDLHAFESLRKGLYVWFCALRTSGARGRVLVSAQICPVVPKLIERAGFAVSFVDVDPAWPTPAAVDFADALDDQVTAVVVSPMYGHLTPDWEPLLARLGRRALVLDLAQGLGLRDAIAPLKQRADAIGYSFGFGKGPDTGGGALFSRLPLPTAGLRSAGRALCLQPAAQGSVLRALTALGLYGSVIGRLPDIDDNELAAFDDATRFTAAPEMFALWASRVKMHAAEADLARRRAAALAARAPLAGALRDPEIYFNAGASHLRQIVRLRDAALRDPVVRALRAAGVDCAPAGELLPAEYFAVGAGGFPNAAAFRADAIRLPFLGRLGDAAFERLAVIMEDTFVQHLS